MIAIGAAVQVSRRSSLGVPVGVRANVRLALQNGRFDIVHGFEPGLPSISYVALRDSEALGVATFFSPERLGFPPRRALREKLLARIDALLATSEQTAAAAAERFPGDYRVISRGVDTELFRPAAKRKLVVIELHSGSLPVARAALRSLRDLPGWEALLLRTKPLSTRPAIPLALRDRVHVRSGRTAAARAALLAEAAIVVPVPPARRGCGSRRRLPALRSPIRRASSSSPSSRRRRSRGSPRTRRCASAADGKARAPPPRPRASPSSRRSSTGSTAGSPAAGGRAGATRIRSPTGPGSSPTCTCTPRGRTTARSRSTTCSTTRRRRASARSRSPTTTSSAARSRRSSARGRDLIVIPGEEVKTDDQGEVIGLFLREEIPRGMTFAETVAAIREQEGVVYLPHPFDRMHAIPFPATLHRHLHEIDVLEVYNARLLFEGYNDEAVRFARKYGLPAGAGSDAHVLQGVGTGALRMRSFDGPGGVPALAAHGRGSAPAEVARVPPEPQVGGPGQGKGPLGENRDRTPVSAAVPTDEIYQRYLQKAISEINELGDEIGRAGDETHVPVLGSGHPLADVFLLKYEPRPSEVQEGVAFYGRAGQALLKSLQRLRVDPMSVYGTNCLKFAGQEPTEAMPWLDRRSSTSSNRSSSC